jgi:hypothetical protein
MFFAVIFNVNNYLLSLQLFRPFFSFFFPPLLFSFFPFYHKTSLNFPHCKTSEVNPVSKSDTFTVLYKHAPLDLKAQWLLCVLADLTLNKFCFLDTQWTFRRVRKIAKSDY